MHPSDIQAIIGLAAIVHPDFPEDAEVLAERQQLFPAGCFVHAGAGGLGAYLLSHPWRKFDPPKLNQRLGSLPQTPTTHFLHDLAVHPTQRGRGVARCILQHLFATIPGSFSLVAVNKSAPFWSHHGFMPVESPGKAKEIASYGPDARFMIRLSG